MISLSVPKENAEYQKRQAEAELNRLMDTYGNDVLRTATMFLKDRQKAEDAFQEVFIKVFNKMDSFKGESSEKTWIIRITINLCKDILRSSWMKRVLLTDKTTNRVIKFDFDKKINRQEENRRLYEAVLSLPPAYKEVVILFYYQEFDTLEISRVLKIAEGTVRSRLHRAREILKKQLEGGLDLR